MTENKILFDYLDMVKKQQGFNFEQKWLVIFYDDTLMVHPDIRAFSNPDEAQEFRDNIQNKNYKTMVTPYSESDEVMEKMMNDYIYSHNKVVWK